MFATQVLPETLSDDSTQESNSEIVGIIIVDKKKYDLKKGETKIGRDASLCSIVIENFTISKVHAVIESDGVDDTFIYDIGSTNQTKLGKKILKPHCRYKLDNDTKITLGNITAKFIIPPDRGSGCSPIQRNFDGLCELGDIFDVPTQVTVPQPTTSSKTSLEKSEESFQVFKIPHSVSPIETSTSSKIFDEDTQCQLNLQQSKPRTVYYGSIENSSIFSLGTQCQLYEPPAKQERNCAVQTVGVDESNKSSESEKIKYLLNDGQDDILMCFMTMHSPSEPSGSLKETKIKTETQSLSEVLDMPTQVQESVEEKERRELNEILQNKESIADFSTSNKPNITSTPLNNKFVCSSSVPQKNNISTHQIADEDFIQTQEFVVNHPESTKQTNNGQDALSQDSETQPYLGDTLDEESENKNVDEDLILTQTFGVSEKSPLKTSVVVPESEQFADKEDFLETQIFPVEPRREARSFLESPDRDVEMTINFTQRNDEDDFIATQIFEKGTDVKNDGGSSDRNDSDDEEDFIATQKVGFPVNKMSNKTNSEAGATTSRGTSPDLLARETFSNNSEDCISTQVFESSACLNLVKTAPEISSRCEKEKGDCNVVLPKLVESSGDETESDLEVILEETKKEDGEPSAKFIKYEQPESKSNTPEINESNSSYVFELEPENQNQQDQDSDATDCEEILMSSKVSLKQEPKEKLEFEDTQVLTLTAVNNFEEKTPCSNDDWMRGAESPRFGCESPLSLEMPNTQEIETTINRIFPNESERDRSPKKTEVGITDSKRNATQNGIEPSKNLVDSPLKRPRDSSSGEVVPVKKCKSETSDRLPRNIEKLFSKLVQAHDIAQIKPNRTRNSLKNLTVESKREVRHLGNNINNERPTSRRKANGKRGNTKNPNGDITPYLTKKVEKRFSHGERTSPKENKSSEGSTRVLRSSIRNTARSNSPDRNIPTRKSSRNSRTKNDEYFGSSCVNVVFTGFDCESLDKIISDLGGKKTNDLSSGEVVVADKVRRTVKFLSAIGLSLPIASPQWLLSCKKEKRFLNPWDFILKDEESEEKWDFELKASLEKSKKSKLLQGFSIFATKSTKPPVKDLLAIVEFCGGTPLFDFPDVWPKKSIIVSCLEDKKLWPLPKFRNIKIVHYEFILSGVLRQKVDFKTYKLR